MMYGEEKIMHETKSHWVWEVEPGHYEVYKTGLTHSVLRDTVSDKSNPDKALAMAIDRCNRRSQ